MENKEIILKLGSLELNGDIKVDELIRMFSSALKQVCDILEKEIDNKDEGLDFCLGLLIHSIIAGKTDKEIADILTQAELIRRDYKKFMENNKEN